jgi:glucose/arabinose dehydrogenase
LPRGVIAARFGWACRGRVCVAIAAAVGACARAGAAHTADPEYVVDTIATGIRNPWSLAFLPDGDMLVTEKFGGLRRLPPGGGAGEVVAGTPAAYQCQDSGLLDVVLDPGFATDSLVYMAFVEGDSAANHTALFRARFDGQRLVDGRVVFRAVPDKAGPLHAGGRIVFLHDGTLLLTIGDGGRREQAQSLASDLGKIVRLDRDGAPARGNPFAGVAGARPELYTYGHRNPQGLLLDPRDGKVWEHEHGPEGGDEMNRIQAGRNYGWPVTTFGIDSSGDPTTSRRTAPGIEPPVLVWVRSIAPSGLQLYLGRAFPQWTGDFFLGALAERSVHRLRVQGGTIVLQETLLRELNARIRDVRTGPDGYLYLLVDDPNGSVLRLSPPRRPDPGR